MKTEASPPIDTSKGISRRDFIKMGFGATGLVASLAVLRALDPLHLFRGPIPPNFFSNETDEGTMGDANSMIVRFEKAERELFPRLIEEDEKRHMIKILFPFQAPEGEKIKYTVNTTTTWQGTNIRQPTLILPKNTKFIVPFDAHFFQFKKTEGQNHVDGIALIRNFPDRGTTGTTYILYVLGKFNLEPIPQSFKILNNMDRWNELPGVGREMPIMITGGRTSVRMYAEVFPGKDIGMHEEAGKFVYNARPRLPGVEFVTAFVDGVEKLVVIGKA